MSLRKTSREIERIIVKIEEGMNGYREQQETCRDKENSRYDVAEGSVECSSGTVKRSSVAKTVLAEAMPNTKSWTTCQIRCLSGRYCVLSKTGEILGVNTSSALQTVADNAVSGKCRKRKISNINNSVINPSDSNSDALETADVPSPLPKPGERQSLQELGDMKELILNLSKKLTELDEKVTKSLQQTLKERNDAESELELPANVQLPLESIEAVERLEAQVEDNNVKNASGEENVCPTLNTVTHSVGRSISNKQKLQGHENVRIIGTAQTYPAAVSMRNAVAETSNIEADDDVSRRIKRPRLCVSADDLLTSESTLRQPKNSITKAYHVTYGLSKRIITVDDSSQLLDKLQSTFGVDNILLQYFNEQFQDWVDVSDLSMITEKSRLNIVQIASSVSCIAKSLPSTCDSSKPVVLQQYVDDVVQESILQPRVSGVSLENILLPCTSGASETGTCNSNSLEMIDSDEDCSESSNATLPVNETSFESDSTRLRRDSWPVRFVIPEFPDRVIYSIAVCEADAAKCLDPRIRRQIISILFNAMIQYTMYPTRSQYLEVGLSLTRKYPALRDTFAANGCYYSSWTSTLRTRFKDWRRNSTDKYHTYMVNKYGKKNKKRSSREITEQECRRSSGKKNFTGGITSSKMDLDTMAKHAMIIQQEMGKKRACDNVVRDRMARCFQTRRREVANSKLTPKDLICKYPCLGYSKWVLEEMSAICEINMERRLDDASDIIKKIKQLALKKWKGIPSNLKEIVEFEELGWLFMASPLLHEASIVVSTAAPTLYPAISTAEGLNVTFDGCSVKVAGYGEALKVLISAYWVFNIQFSPKHSKCLAFICAYVMKMEEIRVPSPVLKFINRL